MTILFAFLAIAVTGAVAVAAAGRIGPGRWRRPAGPSPVGWDELRSPEAMATLGEPDPRLPPVLLPEHPVAADVAELRFSTALRGYRMDEVDEVLERLARALLERDAALAELRSRESEEPPEGPDAPGRAGDIQGPGPDRLE